MILNFLKNRINDGLRFDPKTPDYAGALAEHCLRISVRVGSHAHPSETQNRPSYLITFCADGLQDIVPLDPLRPDDLSPRHAHIAASLPVFISLGLHKNIRQSMEQGLIFEGDPETLHLVEQWFGACQIDWAEMIAIYGGDSLAHSLESQIPRWRAKRGRQWRDLCASLGEYCVEEGLCVPRPLLNAFLQGVDELRAGIDRLEAKLA